MVHVLIETLWNVKNLIEIDGTGHGLGINRNIVECKAASSEKKETTETGINRNIVECKGS